MTDSEKPDDGMWFAPKRYGYGADLPIAWQGWVLTLGYVAAVMGVSVWIEHAERGARVAGFVTVLVLTVVFLIVVHRKTRGGWKWRWGGRD